MQSPESSGDNLRLSTCSAPFSRAYGRYATKVYSGRGADIVMQSSENLPSRSRLRCPLRAASASSCVQNLAFYREFSRWEARKLNCRFMERAMGIETASEAGEGSV